MIVFLLNKFMKVRKISLLITFLFLDLIIIFVFQYEIEIKRQIKKFLFQDKVEIKRQVFSYKIEKFNKDNKFNASSIFFPSKKMIKVFYDFQEIKINKLPYKNNIKYDEGSILLKKKNFKSGIYTLKFKIDEKEYSSLLIINPEFENNGDILAIVPDLTIQAYAAFPGMSFYKRRQDWINDNELFWNNIKNNWKKNNKDIWLNMYRPDNNRKIFKSFDGIIKLQKYYNQKNIKFNFISQKFLHKNYNKFDLNKYKLIILFSHDEYWTYEMQKIIFQSVKNGLNVLNLSGNTNWWTLKEDQGYINRRHYGRNDLNKKVTNHEILLGSSFRFGGYPLKRRYKIEEIKKSHEFKFLSKEKLLQKIDGLEIIKPEDRIFKNTNLQFGDIIGYQNEINQIEMDGIVEIKLISDLVKDKYKKKISKFKLKGTNNEYLATTYASFYGLPRKIGVIGRNNYFNGKIITTGMIGWVNNIKNETIKKITLNMIDELLE